MKLYNIMDVVVGPRISPLEGLKGLFITILVFSIPILIVIGIIALIKKGQKKDKKVVKNDGSK